jgi:hypothetical protein
MYQYLHPINVITTSVIKSRQELQDFDHDHSHLSVYPAFLAANLGSLIRANLI